MFGIELRRSFRPGEVMSAYPARWAGLTYSRPLGPYFHPDLEGMFGIELRRSFRPREVMSAYLARWAGLTYSRPFGPYLVIWIQIANIPVLPKVKR